MEKDTCVLFQTFTHIEFVTILLAKVSHMAESRIRGEDKVTGQRTWPQGCHWCNQART